MSARSRLRLGFLTHVTGGADATEAYASTLHVFEAAEALGYDTGWVAQHHLSSTYGRLPSTLPFLAAAAQRTERIHLGTGLVTLPFEDPVRLAEDAVVVDRLSGGRLELGVGAGVPAHLEPHVFRAFGRDPERQRQHAAEVLEALLRALDGDPVEPGGSVLQPPAGTLRDRVWHSTSSSTGAEAIGRRGLGLLLARRAIGAAIPTPQAQEPVVDAYVRALPTGTSPRVGVSRAVLPLLGDPDDDREVANIVRGYTQPYLRSGEFPPGRTTEEYLDLSFIATGAPGAVAGALASDPVLPRATELMVQVHENASLTHTLRLLETVATGVLPLLQGALDQEEVRVGT
jgi:alkanesulfonate monooxygenase SsuD/methylene tetrahydromethanopterin reductase-like flavin-dependent oxidoreductase (luciferase family)